jgi:3'-phosphoadenosine 5'-phosphosulfate sulfotransferase (PAPS reductase)/FAD synthetase
MNLLKELEEEAIYIIREVASQFNKPCLLFSAGKDSVGLSYLATSIRPVNIYINGHLAFSC